jgi:PAS domain S-box-containing protein
VAAMILSLRTTCYTASIFIALILGFLLLLGSRQYKSHKEYENIIEQNEKIIFQFATIREHITESLLENRLQQLGSITGAIENLNANISQILQQPVIPDEYRISFAGQVDFAGIIILLRSIGSGDLAQVKIRQLNQEIRILSERLMLFDRVIVDHVKRKLVGFQNFVIGLLAFILFIVIYILLFWYGQIAMPLIDLVQQTKEATSGKRSVLSLRKKRGEVAKLAELFQNLLSKQNRTSIEFTRHARLLGMIHNVSKSIWQMQTRDAVFVEACRGVLTNSDYILVWISRSEGNNHLLPAIVNSSKGMSRRDQDECMTALLTAAEKNGTRYDPAHQAAKQKSPVILKDILAELPKGPFKNTPFATSKTDCIALPLVYDQQIFGVMNIYSIAPFSFSEEEVRLLKGMSREIVFAILFIAAKDKNRTLSLLQAARKKLFENNSDLILIIKTDGTIIEANPSALEKLGSASESIIGKYVYDLFHNSSSSQQFLDALTEGSKNISFEQKCSGIDYLVNISSLKNNPEEEDAHLMVARDISEHKNHQTETKKASKLAAMGELSVGVANEINNLANGLINYTQILSDEIEGTVGINEQSIELMHSLINEGERLSKIVQQLLFFNTNYSQTKETVKINKIIEDSLAITQHQFKYDAIDVATTGFQDIVASVKVNVQEMQHIFLNILSNARYALNQRFPGQHPQKRIEIKGEIQARNGRQHLKVVCTDFGVGIQSDIITRVFEPFFSTKPEGVGTGLGLSICRNIVEDSNGTLEIESTPDDHTTITMELPVAA